MYWMYTEKRKILVENIFFYFLKSVQNINNTRGVSYLFEQIWKCRYSFISRYIW